ncbi:hypothetical protein GGX14DRAFT_630547 [Mycena pura]|uniref:Uncharacterized protein n=1 Tax=Mycena pura TaxID=153505 RepID=A0AAD6VDG6_9AGAR|nr:hypothetical protein GGX14DRAFT_630547 [Mycena pura]
MLIFLVATLPLALAMPRSKRAVDFFNPNLNGGAMLDDARLQVIISGLSSPSVLTDDGFLNFAKAIGFSTECLGIHLGGPQTANLGDGNGFLNQTVELRQDYGNADVGTCLESLIGGNHLRAWRQNGPQADSGALFLAVSQEENAAEDHNIVSNGYDIGRDMLSAAAIGTTSFNGVTYSTTGQNITGLLSPGSAG